MPAMRCFLALAPVLLLAACSGTRYASAPPLAFDALDYGFPTRTVDVGPEVAYVDVGQGPRTLVLVHGLASNAGFWRYAIPLLAERYRVVALDLPGYGRSQKAPYPYSMSFYAGTVARVIEALDLQHVVYVGHSMGGQIGLTLALQQPDLLDALVLAAPAGFETFRPGEADWLRGALTVQGIREASEESIRRNLSMNFYRWSDRWEWMVEERARLARHPDFDRFGYAVVHSVSGMLDEPTGNRLGEVRVPALVVYGRYDGLIPNPYLHGGTPRSVFAPGAEALGARLVEIDDAGHLLQIEQPDAFVEAVRAFLEAQPEA